MAGELEGERNWKPAISSASPQPAGAYSPAAVAGGLVFVSGQVPKVPGTGAVIEGGVREQTKQVLENAARALGAAGVTLDDVVSVTVYLADIGLWSEFDAAYRELLRPPYPTRTTVGAGLKGFLVEMSFIAAARASR